MILQILLWNLILSRLFVKLLSKWVSWESESIRIFHCFFPTYEAFAKLPRITVDALLKDKKKLATIIKYYLLPEKLMVSDFKKPKDR